MTELVAAAATPERRLFSHRKIVHMSMVAFAFLLPSLTWFEAAGCAAMALFFNLFVLPHLDVELGKGLGRVAGPSPYGMTWQNPWTGIILYPVSILALILVFGRSMHEVAGVWAIMALGDGMAGVLGEAVRGPTLPFNSAKTWSGFCAFIVAGTLGAYALTRWANPLISPARVLTVSAAAALVGALVESLPIRLDDNLSVPLVCGGFMYCAYLIERSALASNWPYLGRRMVIALAINLVFALLAWKLGTINRSGALVGFLLGVAVYLGYGFKSFLILLAFFLLGSVATRLGYAKKAARGIAERRRGARSWREALANCLPGAFFSILVITTHQEAAFLVALVAAFAEAAGDTVSSEIGQWLSERAYLITTLKPVTAGENGGVSIVGTVAGLAASAAVVVLGHGLGLCTIGGATIAFIAALAGNLLDSVLGATIERHGLVTNGIVNFAGTSFAGGLALAFAGRAGF